jgi:hypothetical protein
MNNSDFLQVITKSFRKYLATHPRSNEKLKILHGALAKNLKEKLANDYSVRALGYEKGKEQNIQGRYIDKVVDIVVSKKEEIVAGIGIKFVMSNYGQNSNNYFESMLGETANIRCARIPYFQILILLDEMPYYNEKGTITKVEKITEHNIDKYVVLSKDNNSQYYHTPTKMLIYIVKLPELNVSVVDNRKKYKKYYNDKNIKLSDKFNCDLFDKNIILNNYEIFIQKVFHCIEGLN